MKKILIVISIILAITILISCDLIFGEDEEEHSNQSIKNSKILWTRAISDELIIVAMSMPRIIYKNGVLSRGYRNNKNILELLDLDSGKPIWSTILSEDYLTFDLHKLYKNNNILVGADGSEVIAINLDNGQIIWRKDRVYFNSNHTITGEGNTYFYADNIQIFKGNLLTGEEELVLQMPFSEEANGNPRPETPEIVYDSNGSKHLIFYTNLWNKDTKHLQAFINLYNLDENKYKYQKLFAEGYWASSDSTTFPNAEVEHMIRVGNDILINAGSKIFRINIWSGETKWVENFPSVFLFSGFLYKNGIFLANCENTRLYSINPDNGKILWDADGAGTSTNMFEMNGVVYFSGGGDGKLHGVDINNGNELLLMEAPERAIDSDIWFTSPVGGHNGKIYVNTPKTAYCIKAVK
jgi:outer membrane protein assembly factor BamB